MVGIHQASEMYNTVVKYVIYISKWLSNLSVALVQVGQMVYWRISKYMWTTFTSFSDSTPYGIPPRHQTINLHKRNQMYIKREGWPIPPEGKMERDKQDDTSKNWFKVIVSTPENGSNTQKKAIKGSCVGIE